MTDRAQIGRIGVAVRDLGRMHDFYRRVLGLPVSPLEAEHFFCRIGSIEFGFFRTASTETPPRDLVAFRSNPAGFDHVVLYVDDAESTRARIEANGGEFGEPISFPTPEGRVTTHRLKDPEGNLLGIQTAPRPTVTAEERLAIIEAVNAFGHAVDARKWDRVRDALAPAFAFDNTSLGGSLRHVRADDIVVDMQNHLEPLDATQHIATNHQLSTRDGAIVCATSYQAHHAFRGEVWSHYGRQVWTLERQHDRWHIVRLELLRAFETGDRAVFARAREAAGAKS